jgi:hypothetical protein
MSFKKYLTTIEEDFKALGLTLSEGKKKTEDEKPAAKTPPTEKGTRAGDDGDDSDSDGEDNDTIAKIGNVKAEDSEDVEESTKPRSPRKSKRSRNRRTPKARNCLRVAGSTRSS